MSLTTEQAAPVPGGKKPFDDFPGFYELDNRQFRGPNPITKGTLEAKCSVLLPEWLVAGKSVLDLGSCLGAAGQWALFYGATAYTGVEIQAEYVTPSRELLSHWGDRARVVQSDIRSFLASAQDQSYDIIVAAGVIYLFVDPEIIVGEMCRVGRRAVVVDTHYPDIVRQFKQYDPRVMITEYRFNQQVNMGDSNDSLLGVAACPSIGALNLFFRLHNFVSREGMLPFPVSPETVVYTHYALTDPRVPARFAVRYERTTEIPALKTLEQNLPQGAGQRLSWAENQWSVEATKLVDQRAQIIESKVKPWEFDEKVASSFEEIADKSIPHYREVIEKTVEVIAKKKFADPKIIDVGCAVGTTLKRLHQAGFKNLYGVDNSRHMLERAFNQATLICSNEFPSQHGPFDVVIANWVLHFIPQRVDYLKAIRASLKPNGIFVLSEKVTSSGMTHDLYHDFKRKRGLSEEDIRLKQEQLVGVLTPYPLTWYLQTLQELGFRSIDVVDADYSFVTIVAEL